MADMDLETAMSGYAVFLFGPRYARENPEKVEACAVEVETSIASGGSLRSPSHAST